MCDSNNSDSNNIYSTYSYIVYIKNVELIINFRAYIIHNMYTSIYIFIYIYVYTYIYIIYIYFLKFSQKRYRGKIKKTLIKIRKKKPTNYA